MIARIVSRRCDCLRNARPSERAADLGAVAVFVVFVGQIAQHSRSILFISDAG